MFYKKFNIYNTKLDIFFVFTKLFYNFAKSLIKIMFNIKKTDIEEHRFLPYLKVGVSTMYVL